MLCHLIPVLSLRVSNKTFSDKTNFMPGSREQLIKSIWTPPSSWKVPGAWFWWFWLFFIHDEDTAKTGKCRQLMILWSIKNEKRISCNSLDIKIPVQIQQEGDLRWKLNGAAAAWYFDGEKMHEDFVLETSSMDLDGQNKSLIASGKTPSSFIRDGDEYVTRINGAHGFEFRARQDDPHAAIGPVHGRTPLPLGMELEGTRIERLTLSGTETRNGKKSEIHGTAYFQKILVAAPAPQWYWGMYHFTEGSFFTLMLPYTGRAAFADNAWKGVRLRKPTLPMQQDILFYHAPKGRLFEGHQVSISPKNEGGQLWSHTVHGKGADFEVKAFARAYSHACWEFVKDVGPLPIKSTFKYNEYPAVLEHLTLRTSSGEKIELKNGWGNMENSWGFLI
jgi:hypothetical protein